MSYGWQQSFPPRPTSFRGRGRELATLSKLVRSDHPTTLALIGGGGSGKSTLAAALGHRLMRHFAGRVAWVRIGNWDPQTVLEMMAFGLGHAPGTNPERIVREAIGAEPALVVLDNHESDATTAAVLTKLRGLPVTWVLTARRCLLGGISIFPVVPPLIERREVLFPRVASLTRTLRWNAVALDIADGLVATKRATVAELEVALTKAGVDRVVPMAHEDDIPEVRAMVMIALARVGRAEKRLLAVLASSRGDDIGDEALRVLARLTPTDSGAIRSLCSLRLIQEPRVSQFTLHATVRAALERVLTLNPERVARFYLEYFEAAPQRLADNPTQLFALMDWAQESGNLTNVLRVHALVEALAHLRAKRGGASDHAGPGGLHGGGISSRELQRNSIA
jgi:hypothetical protein